MRVIEHKVYKFDELSDDAKEKAISNMYDVNIHDGWYDFVYEDAKAIAALMGVDIAKIWFSGFSSQGDGACFEGTYSHNKGSVKAVKAYAPKDAELHNIANTLQNVQKRNFYQLSASTWHIGHYYHSGRMAVSAERDAPNYQNMTDGAESEVIDALRDFADWIYSQLEKEHEHMTSDDAIKEAILANECEFYENGEQA